MYLAHIRCTEHLTVTTTTPFEKKICATAPVILSSLCLAKEFQFTGIVGYMLRP